MVPISAANSAHCPKELKEGVWVFPANKQFNGSRSWWIACDPQPLLIDCPPVNQETIEVLGSLSFGRAPLIVLTNRDSHGSIPDLQEVLGWPFQR